MFRTYILPFLVLTLLPVIFRLIVKLHLLLPLLYAVIAQVFSLDWSLTHPVISIGIFMVFTLCSVLRWFWPLLQSWMEESQLQQLVAVQLDLAHELGIDNPTLKAQDGHPFLRNDS